MKILLTGASGFIGRNLALKLSSLGHRVKCLVRNPGKSEWMSGDPLLEAVVGDVKSFESLIPHVVSVEVVIHLAGLTKARSREEFILVNGVGTGNLARAVSENGKNAVKFLYVSSLAVAGPRGSDNPAVEDDPPSPITNYGESKLLGERLLLDEIGAIPWTIVRPPIVYGPHDRDFFVYFKMAHHGFVPLVGRGNLDLSMIHVDDLVEGLVLAAFREESDHKVYYVSDGKVYTQEDIADLLLRVTGRGRKIHLPRGILWIAGKMGDFLGKVTGKGALISSEKVKEAMQEGWTCSPVKIGKELGYSPGKEASSGFEETYRWYRRSGWL